MQAADRPWRDSRNLVPGARRRMRSIEVLCSLPPELNVSCRGPCEQTEPADRHQEDDLLLPSVTQHNPDSGPSLARACAQSLPSIVRYMDSTNRIDSQSADSYRGRA